MPPASTVAQHIAQGNHDNFRIRSEPLRPHVKRIFSQLWLIVPTRCTPSRNRDSEGWKTIYTINTYYMGAECRFVNTTISTTAERPIGWMVRPFSSRWDRENADLFLIDDVCSFLQRPPARWRGSGDRAGSLEWTGGWRGERKQKGKKKMAEK